MTDGHEVKERRPFEDTRRTLHFWRRASGVYFAYKGAQARAAFLSKARGWDADRLKEEFWKPHHTWYINPCSQGGPSSQCRGASRGLHVGMPYTSATWAIAMQGWEGIPLHGGGPERVLFEGWLDAQQPCMALADLQQVAEVSAVLADLIALSLPHWMGYPWVLHCQKRDSGCSWDNSLLRGLNLYLSLSAGS